METGRDQCTFFRLVSGAGQLKAGRGRHGNCRAELPGGAAGGANCGTELLVELSGELLWKEQSELWEHDGIEYRLSVSSVSARATPNLCGWNAGRDGNTQSHSLTLSKGRTAG